jgi:DNA-directed RNA polymerase II subunit RPB1
LLDEEKVVREAVEVDVGDFPVDQEGVPLGGVGSATPYGGSTPFGSSPMHDGVSSPFPEEGGFSPAMGAASFSPAYSPSSGNYGAGFESGSYGSSNSSSSPLYSPTSPQYSPTSPAYSPTSPQVWCSSLYFSLHRPLNWLTLLVVVLLCQYSPTSPAYSPTSPQVSAPSSYQKGRRRFLPCFGLFVRHLLVFSDQSGVQSNESAIFSHQSGL